MNINNLFDYCTEMNITENNSIYYIGNSIGNSLFTLSIDNITNKIYSYSNEWLYLIKSYYPNSQMYNEVVNIGNHIVSTKHLNTTFMNENVLPLITSFSTGTVHGYAGLFCMLFEYFENYELYKDLKLLVYVNSQKGILDIINHLINKNIFNRDQIIYLNPNIQYLFNKITFIPNKYHVFHSNNDVNLGYQLEPYINKWFINDKNDINYYNSLNLSQNDKICIIKSSHSNNLTPDGGVNINNIINFCNKNNFTFVEPVSVNEVELIHNINKSRIIILSWGTAFMKNHIYISNNCEKIIVLVIGDNFIGQYSHAQANNVLITRFKNAIIEYHVVPYNLNFNL